VLLVSNVIVKYDPHGRMGNRMFQFAFGKILSTISDSKFYVEPISNFKNTYINNVSPLAQSNNTISLKKTYGDNCVNLDDVIQLLNLGTDIIVDSFLQRYEYYTNFKPLLEDMFKLDIIDPTPDADELVVHIRETDYKLINTYLSDQYYIDAIKKLNYDKVTIVTDNCNASVMDTLKEMGCKILSTEPVKGFSIHNNEPIMVDYGYMLNAKHLLISHSSFSWWPAFLGDADNIFVPDVNGMWKFPPTKDGIDLCLPTFKKLSEI